MTDRFEPQKIAVVSIIKTDIIKHFLSSINILKLSHKMERIIIYCANNFNLLDVPAVIKKGDPWKTVLQGQDIKLILESIKAYTA
ncbi:MAG TPA: hypothetical protein VE971_05620 [Candidatus Eisenbacteria bacterium]|nr:hypothetical protein [Candidatus Eisenbacteria bacterium]